MRFRVDGDLGAPIFGKTLEDKLLDERKEHVSRIRRTISHPTFAFWQALRALDTSAYAKTLLLVLHSYAAGSRYVWSPQRKFLADLAGMSESTYGKAIRELVDLGILRRVRRADVRTFGYELFPSRADDGTWAIVEG